MFVIRQAVADDHHTLHRLAKTVQFLNLPADQDAIRNKIVRARRSFAGKVADPREREFVFVLEDAATGNVIGTSSIESCVSWPGHPRVYFAVRRRELYSADLQTGQVHVTLTLGTDESGPSELGGLILAGAYRGRPEKLGSLLAFVRFHYVGLHPEWFSERIVAELMPPLTADSHNTLWEYLGRRFINLSYLEADRFSVHSKEFILSLFPREEIYVSLLPPEARALIGRVGPETEPARAMLERLGFAYDGHIDPFDGGPHLEARRDAIPLVASTRRTRLEAGGDGGPLVGLVSAQGRHGFRAVRTRYADLGEAIAVPDDVPAALEVEPGAEGGVTPLGKATEPAAKRAERGAATDEVRP